MNLGRRNLAGILPLLAVALVAGCASAPPQTESGKTAQRVRGKHDKPALEMPGNHPGR